MEEIKLKGLNETIYCYETKSGLKVYMWVNEKINSMYASLTVKYGSIHTKFKVGKKVYEVPNGIAHFLEHIKFNESEDVTAHDNFYKIGGDSNAFTTFTHTSYLVFATKNKKENLQELLKFVYNPYFTKKTVSKEKGIIIEESNMGVDNPDNMMFYKAMKNTFKKSKFRNLIVGTPEEIESITLEDVKLVFDTFYHPKNMFLTITGNFNPYEMASLVSDFLEKQDFKEYTNPLVINECEPRKVVKKYYTEELNITYPCVRINLKMEKSRFKDYTYIETRILFNLIFNMNIGLTSDFQDELIEKGIIQNLRFACDFYEDYFLVSIVAVTNFKDEYIERIKDKLANLSVSSIDFKRKINSAIASLILDYEDVENVSFKIQDEILNEGHIITNIKDILSDIELTDLEEFIKLIDTNNMSINVFLPKENQKAD